MIKHALAMSFMLISAQAIASTPCPTCKKSYVASSLEEALVAYSNTNTKNPSSQKAPRGYSFLLKKAKSITSEETPAKKIINKQTAMAKRTGHFTKESEIRSMSEYAARRELELLSQSMYKKSPEDFGIDVWRLIQAKK